MFSTTNKAQKCRVWCECLKKPCHRIWSITLSGGRLGAEGTCNFRWSDGIGLPHTFYPATQALPHTAPPAPNDHQSPPNEGAHFARAFFPSPTVLLIMEEEKILKFGAFQYESHCHMKAHSSSIVIAILILQALPP